MVRVTIGGITREYEEGTQLKTAAEEFQNQYENDILLATVNGKLQELHKTIPDDAEVGFLTAADKPGMLTYRRSALLMMLKAFYDVAGRDNVRKLSVEFAVGNGLYIDAEGDFERNEELLSRVKAKMREYCEARIPIKKRSVNTDEAMELFHRHKMYDKERLFY